MKVPARFPVRLPCKIALVGEAPGQEEEMQGQPFVGASGTELKRMLRDAGISESECLLTNLLQERPGTIALKERLPLPEKPNDFKCLCLSRSEVKSLDPDYDYTSIEPGGYLHPAIAKGALERLREELTRARPNVIVALGNKALWALTGRTGISSLRGTVTTSEFGHWTVKTLPTYHPAAVLRNWEYRVVVVADLIKARLEAEFPEIRRPSRELWIDPTLEDLEVFWRDHLGADQSRPWSIDVETRGSQVTHFGVAPSPDLAIVVPFYDERFPKGSYWPDVQAEARAWRWVDRVCRAPNPKLGQNFIYDLSRLERHGLRVRNFQDDTMLIHHALFPELPKNLGFLGSIYTNEVAWKILRGRGRGSDKKQLKRED